MLLTSSHVISLWSVQEPKCSPSYLWLYTIGLLNNITGLVRTIFNSLPDKDFPKAGVKGKI